jgi:hypothetical protein
MSIELLPERKLRTHCKRGHSYEEVGFYKYGSGSRGCKACIKLRDSQPHRQEAIRKWNNGPEGKASRAKWNRAHRHGLTYLEYEQLYNLQDGICAICEQEPRSKTGGNGECRLVIDHDHSCCPGKRSCGKCIRGLICPDCNIALGKFQDSTKVLHKAIVYLERGK